MSKIEQQVINTIKQRAKLGKQKYGKTMDRRDLSTRDWLQHLQEELLDAAVYVEKLKEKINSPPTIARKRVRFGALKNGDSFTIEGVTFIKVYGATNTTYNFACPNDGSLGWMKDSCIVEKFESNP